MTEFVDRAAGVAAFRKAGSLCFRLHGRLDTAMAGVVAARLRGEAAAVRLRLECSTLEDAEPGAAGVLARALLAWSQRRPDRSIDVLNLNLALGRRAAWHPLRIFLEPDELLFFDPDGDPYSGPFSVPFSGPAPSRH